MTLIGETEQDILDARRQLVRIGIDDLAGAAVGEISALAAGSATQSYPVSDFAGLAAVLADRSVQVLDARSDSERADGHIRGSLHIPLPELSERLDEVPAGEVWVHCGSGYRASIATSILDRAGRDPVLVDDAYDNAAKAGLEIQEPG